MKLGVFGLFLTVLTINSSSVFANDSAGLMEIYELALQSDPQISAAKFGRDAGLEKSEQGLSLLLPQISFSAGISYSKTKVDSLNIDQNSDNRNFGLQLSQPLFNASSSTSYKQSKIVVDQAELEYRIAEQDLILRVAQAYFDVLSAQENLAVNQAETRAFAESLARANLTFKVGTATKTDKLEAQARFDLARASELSAENLLAIAKQTLSSITGVPTKKLKSLVKNSKLTSINPTEMEQWNQLALANNYQLQLSQTSLDIAKKEMIKLKDDRLPTINLVASARENTGFSANLGTDITTDTLSIGLELSLPLYTGGLMSSRIREAEHLRFQQKELQTNSQRQVLLQTQQAYLTVMNGFQQIDALEQALISSESALQATKKGLEVGVRTNLDVLDSQQQYFSTERDFRIAKFNYLLQILNLKAAAGILSAEDIQSLNALLVSA